MSVGALEDLGYLLWEGMMLITIILGTIGFVAIRRKMSGKPAFTAQDRKLLFNTPAGRPALHVCFRFALAMLLFAAAAICEIPLFAPSGAAILFVSLLVSCAGIINLTLL